MRKIDVMKTYEKVKVSLALDSETFELIENSLAGFRLINMLAKSNGNTSVLDAKTGESQYAAISNRSDFLSQIVNAISSEKIFTLGITEYSLKDMADFFEDLALASRFPYYVNIPALFAIKNLENHPIMTAENIEKMRNMNLDETYEFFYKGSEKLSMADRWNYLLYTKINKDDNETSLKPILTTKDVWEYYESNENGEFKNVALYLTDSPDENSKFPAYTPLADFEPTKFLSVIQKKSKELVVPYTKKIDRAFKQSLQQYSTFPSIEEETSRDAYQDLVDGKLSEMLKVIEDKMPSKMTIMKILRNQLFGEDHVELVNLLQEYIKSKLDLEGSIERKDTYETTDS